MRIKTINGIITKKINNWIASIADNDLKTDILDHVIVTGGSIVSLLQNERVNDFDIYFDDLDIVKRVMCYYHSIARKLTDCNIRMIGIDCDDNKEFWPEYEEPTVRYVTYIKSSGVARLRKHAKNDDIDKSIPEDYRPVFLSSNAITLTNDIQLVTRFHGDPATIHSNYDFVHCTSYWTNDTGVVTNTKALEAILAKELVYFGSKYPLASIIRSRKFITRGWRINAGQYLKMAMQLNELNLNNIEVLKEQLTGVDSAYFEILFRKLDNLAANDTIDTSYVMKIVDELF